MIPKKIKTGDTIGIVSPASIENISSIDKGIKFFQDKGFNVKKGKHIYDKWGYFAGSDQSRAEDLMDMFLDDEVNMILCLRGGYGTMRILNYIDFNEISKHPKIFAGFSDITVLLNSIYQKSNLITFHSPMLSSNFEDAYTSESFFYTLCEGDKPYSIKNPNGYELITEIDGKAEGELAGGNISLLCSLMGTPYEVDFTDKILFLEEVKEEPYKIDRMLTQLLVSGKLQKCRGFVLGQFFDCDAANLNRGFSLKEVLENRILSLKKPTFSNFMSGHMYPKLTIPIGAKVSLNFDKLCIDVLEPVTI